jgi:hypothetical protein
MRDGAKLTLGDAFSESVGRCLDLSDSVGFWACATDQGPDSQKMEASRPARTRDRPMNAEGRRVFMGNLRVGNGISSGRGTTRANVIAEEPRCPLF